MTDAEWKQLMKESPQLAYRALIDQYANLVYAIILNKLRAHASREDIEDCVSDVFVEVFKNAEDYSPSDGSLKVYLSIIAKHKAIDTYRRITYRNNRTSEIDETEFNKLPSENNTENEIEKKLFNNRLWGIIKTLGEPDSSIIVRQYFYEQTSAEIAKALSMTASAVQKRSQRARSKIKEILTREFNLNGKGDCCENA